MNFVAYFVLKVKVKQNWKILRAMLLLNNTANVIDKSAILNTPSSR
jgi:hypothetical protein